MLIAPFCYERPASLAEAGAAIARLRKNGEPFALCAGGTDLVPGLKQQGASPGTLVSLSALGELRGIDRRRSGEAEACSIGALVTLAELAASPEVRLYLSCLAETARKVATPQIRNRATLGGNLLVNNRCSYFNQSRRNRAAHGACFKSGGEACHVFPAARRGQAPLCRARFVSDLAPVLLLLRARLHLVSETEERRVGLEDFYVQDGIERNRLEAGEILARIEVAVPPRARVGYEKLRIRNAIDFPSVGVAVGWDESAAELGVALTGVNPYPVLFRLLSAEHASSEALVEAACREAEGRAQPLKQDFLAPSYRRMMIPVLVRRAAREVLPGGGRP